MKFDIQVPLTASQFERLKPSENLKADLVNVLPKTKYDRIRTFLGDPAYLFSIVRPYKGKASYLLVRIERPIQIVSYSHQLYRLVQKGARISGITVNQFIQVALRHKLDKLEGVR